MLDVSNAEVHIIYGAANRGKSTLVFYTVNYMLLYGSRIICNMDGETICNYPYIGDYCIILKFNGKTYLIMSRGDHTDELKAQWDHFKHFNIKIDVIIGVSRTREATPKWWKNKMKPNSENVKRFENNDDIKTESAQHNYHLAQFQKFKTTLGIV